MDLSRQIILKIFVQKIFFGKKSVCLQWVQRIPCMVRYLNGGRLKWIFLVKAFIKDILSKNLFWKNVRLSTGGSEDTGKLDFQLKDVFTTTIKNGTSSY